MNNITLLAPAGGEFLQGGCSHLIIWRQPGKHDARLDFSLDGGNNWQRITERAVFAHIPGLAPSQRELGQFAWNVPQAASTRCRVRVTQADQPEISVSSPDFTISIARPIPKYRWTCMTEQAPFAPRDGAGLLSFRGRLWQLGGWNPRDKEFFPKICNNEVWASDNGADWELIKPNTFKDGLFDPETDWEGRHTAGYAVFQDKMWLVGGDCNQGHYHPDVWRSEDGRHWRRVASSLPWGQRCLHYTVVHAGKIWVMGGQTLPAFAPAELRHYNDVWFSENGADWQQATPSAPWAPRGMIGGAAVLHDRIWLPGGGIYGYTPGQQERLYYSDIWSSANGVAWERSLIAPPWPARSYHEVAAFDGRLWALEGCNVHIPGPPNRNDVWHSEDGVNWHELPDVPWQPRHAAGVCVHDNALWVVAGNNMQSDVWKLERVAAA